MQSNKKRTFASRYLPALAALPLAVAAGSVSAESLEQRVQRRHWYAIIDEVDDIQDADGLDVDDRDIARDVDDLDDEASATASMREMIVYIARALASNPDAVSVTEEDGGDRIYLHLSVDDQDKGKVIGRDGRVAQSMRSLLRVAAVKAGTRVSLEID